jgi:Bacteriophage lambda head decoration protein D
MSQFPVQTEKAHPTEFVLSEAAGQRSRDNGYLADPVTLRPAQPLTAGAAATTDKPQTFTVATTGANCHAIALYGGQSVPVDGLRVAVLTRDAEVNGRLIDWGAMSTAEQVTAVATLATKGIIVRF